jgi:hypothetical protein
MLKSFCCRSLYLLTSGRPGYWRLFCLKARYRPGIINITSAEGVGVSRRLSTFAIADSKWSAMSAAKGVHNTTNRTQITVVITKISLILLVIVNLHSRDNKLCAPTRDEFWAKD